MDRDNPQDIFPHDGAAHSFDVVIRGYDRSQVHDVVDRLDGELRVALADQDASAARAADLAKTLADAQTELESLRHKAQSAAAPNFESMGARISHMLKLAEEEANDIRRIAGEEHERSQAELKATTAEGERVRTQAQAEGKRTTEQAQAEARRMTEEAQDAAAKTVAQAQKQADDLNERARVSAEQAEIASRARVAKIEEDFQLAQKARRAEAARVEQERDQSSRRDAQSRIEKAQRKSDEVVAAAEKRVGDLDDQRGELHARLTQVREILGALPDLAIPTVIEPSATQAAKNGASNGRAEAPADGGATEPSDKPDAAVRKSTPEAPTDVQDMPPPPPVAPRWPANQPTQALHLPSQGGSAR
ncbi:MAG: hypothetical protein H0T54_09770 [Geodermatophilaceae bacterium]|nr:hypothetical protein [Geodermatophilaceae bacterium]